MTSFASETEYMKQRLDDIRRALDFFRKVKRQAQPDLIDPTSSKDEIVAEILLRNIEELEEEMRKIQSQHMKGQA